MANNKVIGWGKCTVTEGTGNSATVYDDIIEGTAALEVEEGEELEALIEGGESEARKKKADKYTLRFSRRIGTAAELDAIKAGEEDIDVSLEPELVGAIGVSLEGTSKRVTARYDTTDGMVADYSYKTKGAVGDDGSLDDITFIAKAS